MKRGTTTPLPPYPTPLFYCIEALEKQIEDNHNRGLEVKLNYYYELSVYWEYVYLMVTRQKFYDGIF